MRDLIEWAISNPGTFALTIIMIILITYILWLRWRMSTSKARFALAAIAAISWCPLALFAFMSGPLPLQIMNTALMIGGMETVRISVDTPTWYQNIFAVIAAVFSMFCIYKFSLTTIKNWNGPTTVNVNELTKQNQDRNIALLAFVELRRLVKLQPDPLASDVAVNWQQRQVDAPKSPAWSDFVRSLFEAAYREATFPEPAWRDRVTAWVGRIYLQDTADTAALILLVFYSEPSDEELHEKISQLQSDGFVLKGAKIYAVHEAEQTGSVDKKVGELTIKIHSKGYLLRSGLRLTDYARDLIRRFDEETLGGTDATLKDTFVEAHVIAPGTSIRVPLSEVVDNWLLDRRRRHLAITGEYGQGKSTAMLHMCAAWARKFISDNNVDGRIPILIELRGQNPSEVDPLAFLSSWAGRYGLSPRQLYNLVRDGKAIVIFEGFDELRNAGRAYDRHEHFNALWRMAFPGSKIIFTGRPNFFLDEKEKNRTLRTDSSRGAGGNAFTELWELDRLTLDELRQVTTGFGRELSEAVVDAAVSHPAFFDIVSRPSMLPVVATIWDTIVELQKAGHDFTSAILLERYLQAIYRRKEEEIERDKRVNSAPEGSSYLLLPRELREVFTLAIAWSMAGSDARNTITRADFDNIISETMDDLFKAFQQAGVPANITARIRMFEERYRDETRSDKLERISNEVATAGLFVPDPAGGPSNLRFPHKQFYEYLISKSAWYVLVHDQTQTAKILSGVNDRLSPYEKMISERQSLLFFSDIIGSDFSVFRTFIVRFNLAFFKLILIYMEMANTAVEKIHDIASTHYSYKGAFPGPIYYAISVVTKHLNNVLPSRMIVDASFFPESSDYIKNRTNNFFSNSMFIPLMLSGLALGYLIYKRPSFHSFEPINILNVLGVTIFPLFVFLRNSIGKAASSFPPPLMALLIIIAHKSWNADNDSELTIYQLVSTALNKSQALPDFPDEKRHDDPLDTGVKNNKEYALHDDIKPII